MSQSVLRQGHRIGEREARDYKCRIEQSLARMLRGTGKDHHRETVLLPILATEVVLMAEKVRSLSAGQSPAELHQMTDAARDIIQTLAAKYGIDLVIGDSGATSGLAGALFGCHGDKLSDFGLKATGTVYSTADASAADIVPLGKGTLTVAAIDNIGRLWLLTQMMDFCDPAILPTTLASPFQMDNSLGAGGKVVAVHGTPELSHLAIEDDRANVVGRIAAPCVAKSYITRVLPLEAALGYKPPAGMPLDQAVIGDVARATRVLLRKGALKPGQDLLSVAGLPPQLPAHPGRRPKLVTLACRNSLKLARAAHRPAHAPACGSARQMIPSGGESSAAGNGNLCECPTFLLEGMDTPDEYKGAGTEIFDGQSVRRFTHSQQSLMGNWQESIANTSNKAQRGPELVRPISKRTRSQKAKAHKKELAKKDRRPKPKKATKPAVPRAASDDGDETVNCPCGSALEAEGLDIDTQFTCDECQVIYPRGGTVHMCTAEVKGQCPIADGAGYDCCSKCFARLKRKLKKKVKKPPATATDTASEGKPKPKIKPASVTTETKGTEAVDKSQEAPDVDVEESIEPDSVNDDGTQPLIVAVHKHLATLLMKHQNSKPRGYVHPSEIGLHNLMGHTYMEAANNTQILYIQTPGKKSKVRIVSGTADDEGKESRSSCGSSSSADESSDSDKHSEEIRLCAGCSNPMPVVDDDQDSADDEREHVRLCPCCSVAKGAKPAQAKKGSVSSSKIPGERIFLDSIGPLPRAHCGSRWLIVATDECTDRVFIQPCQAKTPANARRLMQKVVMHYSTLGYEKPAFAHSDRGTEFTGSIFQEWLNTLNIDFEPTSSYSPAKNGRAERSNRRLLERMRSMLLHAKMSDLSIIWPECALHAASLLNVVWKKRLGTSPHIYERRYAGPGKPLIAPHIKQIPNGSGLKVWGSRWALTTTAMKKRWKAAPANVSAFYVGQSKIAPNSGTGRFFVPEYGKRGCFIETAHSVREEDLMENPRLKEPDILSPFSGHDTRKNADCDASTLLDAITDVSFFQDYPEGDESTDDSLDNEEDVLAVESTDSDTSSEKSASSDSDESANDDTTTWSSGVYGQQDKWAQTRKAAGKLGHQRPGAVQRARKIGAPADGRAFALNPTMHGCIQYLAEGGNIDDLCGGINAKSFDGIADDDYGDEPVWFSPLHPDGDPSGGPCNAATPGAVRTITGRELTARQTKDVEKVRSAAAATKSNTPTPMISSDLLCGVPEDLEYRIDQDDLEDLELVTGFVSTPGNPAGGGDHQDCEESKTSETHLGDEDEKLWQALNGTHVIRLTARKSTKSYYIDPDAPPIGIALTGPERKMWIEACRKELRSHLKYKTWSVVSRSEVPKGTVLLRSGWRLLKKYQRHRFVKAKARGYVCGYSQIEGVHYSMTVSPTPRAATFRMLVANSVEHDLTLYSGDVRTAFLHSELDFKCFMRCFQHASMLIPDVIEDDKCILSLKKSLYGLKQSSALFFRMMAKKLGDLGFQGSPEGDSCLFVRAKVQGTGEILKDYDVHERRKDVDLAQLVVYVDDVCCAASSKQCWLDVVEDLKETFDLIDEGELNTFIGVEYNKLPDGSVALSHQSKIEKIAASVTDFLPRRVAMSPFPEGLTLPKLAEGDQKPMSAEDQELVDAIDYRGLVGGLLHTYIMVRADIGYQMSQLSRHVAAPNADHVRALLHLISYLLNTKDCGPRYEKGTDRMVEVYADAAYGDCVITRRSTTGWCIIMNGAVIAWSSKRQATVSLSTTEAELSSLRDAVCEVVALKRDMQLLDPRLASTTWRIYEDNNAAKLIVEGGGKLEMRKHFSIRAMWLREGWLDRLFSLTLVGTKLQAADELTKSLSGPLTQRHRQVMFNEYGSAAAAAAKDVVQSAKAVLSKLRELF